MRARFLLTSALVLTLLTFPHIACASSSIGGIFDSSRFGVRQGGDFFQLDVSPDSVTISTNPSNDGNLGFVTVYVQAYNNYEGTIHFDILNVPQAVVARFEQNDIEITQTNTLVGARLKLIAATNAEKGDYVATVTAVGTGASERRMDLMIHVIMEQQKCPGGAVCPSENTYTTSTTSEAVPFLALLGVGIIAIIAVIAIAVAVAILRERAKVPRKPTESGVTAGQLVGRRSICKNCGSTNPPYAANYCVRCGARLSSD